MKLSSLTQQDKIKLAAELDGKECICKDGLWDATHGNYACEVHGDLTLPYDTSYDAIIPLIQKCINTRSYTWEYLLAVENVGIECKHHNDRMYAMLLLTPSQLLDALLVATGKAEL